MFSRFSAASPLVDNNQYRFSASACPHINTEEYALSFRCLTNLDIPFIPTHIQWHDEPDRGDVFVYYYRSSWSICHQPSEPTQLAGEGDTRLIHICQILFTFLGRRSVH